MKKLLNICIALSLLGISSCRDKVDVFQYNENMVDIHDRSSLFFEEQSSKILNAIDTDEGFDALQELKVFYSDIITDLDTMPYPSEADEFHATTKDLYRYMRDSVISLYDELLEVNPQTVRWYDILSLIDERLVNDVAKKEENVIAEQKKFAFAVSNR